MCGRPEEEVWQVYGRTPKVIDIFLGSLFNIKGARLTLTPGHFISSPTTGTLYGTMGFELTAYIKYYPLMISLDNGQIHCTKGVLKVAFTTHISIRRTRLFF